MINFGSIPEQKEFKKGKFIRPGVQNLILRDITLQTSKNTHNERPVFFMETEPVADPGWEGYEGAQGQIGNVSGNYGYYLKNESQILDFIGNLRDILKAVGTYDAFMEQHGTTDFEGSSLQPVLDAVKPFLVDKKARYFVCAEQYQKLDNSGVGLRLKFPSKRMVESLESDSKFSKFDETNPSHFKKLQKAELTKAEDNLPF